jgi:hypothetical protein
VTHFYATPRDMLQLLSEIDSRSALSYTLTGLFESPKPQTYARGEQLPALSRSAATQTTGCDSYLVLPLSAEVCVRPVPQFVGGVLYAIDQLENPESTVLTPAGLHAQNLLIAGRVATAYDLPAARKLQSLFHRTIRRLFAKHQAFYLGNEASAMWRSGCRLTFNVGAPSEYDLA